METIDQKPEIPNIFLINEIQFKEERDKLYKKHQKEKRGSIFIYEKNRVGQQQVLKIRTYLCLKTSIFYTQYALMLLQMVPGKAHVLKS